MSLVSQMVFLSLRNVFQRELKQITQQSDQWQAALVYAAESQIIDAINTIVSLDFFLWSLLHLKELDIQNNNSDSLEQSCE